MFRIASAFVVSVASFVVAIAPAAAEKRVALVVEMASPEEHSRLASMLEIYYGFTVFELTGDETKIEQRVAEFKTELAEGANADFALVYYSGFSAHNASDSFLVPASWRDGQAAGSVRVKNLLAELKDKSRKSLAIFDATMHERKGEKENGGLTPGLGALEGDETLLVAYDTVTVGDDDKRPSYFKESLLRQFGGGRVQPVKLASLVREDVHFASGGAQLPWLRGSLAASTGLDMPTAGLDHRCLAALADTSLQMASLTQTCPLFGQDRPRTKRKFVPEAKAPADESPEAQKEKVKRPTHSNARDGAGDADKQPKKRVRERHESAPEKAAPPAARREPQREARAPREERAPQRQEREPARREPVHHERAEPPASRGGGGGGGRGGGPGNFSAPP